ncbi:MAG: AAA family ATPase, partial [Candidatus Heimdallarchaeota archaeon]|nr:AAA family ATPase [Candidatus Heimdallarchaeota archaeon]
MKSVAVHSHKGGVGKTTIAINLAVLLAKEGSNVCLIDADFSAPNLNTYFNLKTTNYLNAYFDKKIQVGDVLHDIELSEELTGKLWLGLADPTANSINSMIRIDNRSAGNMLQKLLQLKRAIRGDPYNIDYLILDTTPGIGLTTINSFVLTDNILFIIKLSNADIEGTIHMIGGLLDKLPNRSTMVANQIPADKIETKEQQDYLTKLITETMA